MDSRFFCQLFSLSLSIGVLAFFLQVLQPTTPTCTRRLVLQRTVCKYAFQVEGFSKNLASLPAAFDAPTLRIRFWNNFPFSVSIYWAGFDGTLQLIQTLEAGEDLAHFIKTLPRAVFVAKRLGDSSVVAVIRVPERDFHRVIYPLMELDSFEESYWRETGRRWMNTLPRSQPIHPIFDSEHSSLHVVETNHVFAGMQAEAMNVTLQTLSRHPQAFVIDKLVSPEEAEMLIELAQNQFKQEKPHDSNKPRSTWIDLTRTRGTLLIAERILQVLGIETQGKLLRRIAEDFRVSRFSTNQSYRSRYDWFQPLWSSSPIPVRERGANRFASIFIFLRNLSADAQGGEIVLPYQSELISSELCQNSLITRIQPRQGRALILYHMLEDGNLDEKALHAGCPVSRGENWIIEFHVWDPEAFL